MKEINWKPIAILFIVLFVVETLIVVLLMNIGSSQLSNEDKCMDYCAEEYESYYVQSDYCFCFEGREVKEQISIKEIG